MSPVRCGRIPYTNVLPIHAALDADVLQFPGDFVSAVPSRLNQMLLAGELDLSPVSSAFFIRHQGELVRLPPLCIAAKERVLSVLLYSHEPPAAFSARSVAVTAESESGALYLQLVLAQRYGLRPDFIVAADPLDGFVRAGSPALVIGDRALDALERLPAAQTFDVASLWRDWTGTPAVFAVWAARRDLYERKGAEIDCAIERLAAAYRWGCANDGAVVAQAQQLRPRADGFYDEYYRALSFEFDSDIALGFERFGAEIREHDVVAA